MKKLLGVLVVLGGLVLLAGAGLFLAGLRSSAGHNEASVEIAAKAPEVFNHLVDLQRLKSWVGWKEVTLLSEGELKAGSRFRVITGSDDWRIELFGEVTALEPNQRVAMMLRSDDPSFRFSERAEFRVEQREMVTRVSMTTNAEYHDLKWRLAEPLITTAAQKRLEGDVVKLRQLVEGRP